MVKAVLVGAEGSGKTTLCRSLKVPFPSPRLLSLSLSFSLNAPHISLLSHSCRARVNPHPLLRQWALTLLRCFSFQNVAFSIFSVVFAAIRFCQLLYTTAMTGGVSCKLAVWDTAGRERYRSLLPLHVKSAQVVAIVVDVDVSPPESASLLTHVDEWIGIVRSIHPKAKVMVMGNKIDALDKRQGSGDDDQSFKVPDLAVRREHLCTTKSVHCLLIVIVVFYGL